MESWLGERIRKRLESRKYQFQAQPFSGVSNGKVQPLAQGSEEKPTEAPKDVVTSREVPTLEVAKRDGMGSDSEPCLKASALLSAPQSPQEGKPSAWWSKFIGLSTREVSREDAVDCVRLVLTELWGEERAWEARIELEGVTVRLNIVYHECERLTGNPACWGIVQQCLLRARRREGIRPNTGVLLMLPTQGNRAASPWLEEGSGMRRQLADDGAWCG